MAARQNSTFITRAGGPTMAMSFVGSSDGQITSSWQQFKIATRGSEVKITQFSSIISFYQTKF